MGAGIGTITVDDGVDNVGPSFMTLIHFAGDGAYPTGGTPGFAALVKTAVGKAKAGSRQILAVIPQDCGGYKVSYDYANDKLKVWWNTSSDDSPSEEVDGTPDLSATTFNVLVIWK